VVSLVALPATAQAETSTFQRFEANAVAIYRDVTQPSCSDGTTARLGFRVTGGHEEESERGIVTEDDEFFTVFVNGTDCGGVFVNDTGTGDAAFTWSPSLQTTTESGHHHPCRSLHHRQRVMAGDRSQGCGHEHQYLPRLREPLRRSAP
jgi:hypothetical protein